MLSTKTLCDHTHTYRTFSPLYKYGVQGSLKSGQGFLVGGEAGEGGGGGAVLNWLLFLSDFCQKRQSDEQSQDS